MLANRRPRPGDLNSTFADLPSECEVLVEVAYSAVNPVDRSFANAAPGAVFGSDLSGVVVELGSACAVGGRLRVGDLVWADIGANAATRAGVARKENGAYAPYALAIETQLGAAPAGVSLQEAGALPKVALTSYKALAFPHTHTQQRRRGPSRDSFSGFREKSVARASLSLSLSLSLGEASR